MYKVSVTSHPYWNERNCLIRSVKMFRMVTGLPLKESKDVIENMMGKKWDTSLPIEKRVIRFKRIPYIVKASSLIKAEQIRIEFMRGGFTVEVLEDHG